MSRGRKEGKEGERGIVDAQSHSRGPRDIYLLFIYPSVSQSVCLVYLVSQSRGGEGREHLAVEQRSSSAGRVVRSARPTRGQYSTTSSCVLKFWPPAMHASLLVLGPRSRGLGPGQKKRASGPDNELLEKEEASGDLICTAPSSTATGQVFSCAPSDSRSSSAPSPLTRAEVQREEDSGARTESCPPPGPLPRTSAAPNASGRPTWPAGRTFIYCQCGGDQWGK